MMKSAAQMLSAAIAAIVVLVLPQVVHACGCAPVDADKTEEALTAENVANHPVEEGK